MKGFYASRKHFLQVFIIVCFFVFSSFPSSGSSLNFLDVDCLVDDSTCVKGEILYVGGSGPGNFSSVHEAYSNCSDGDTIFIYNGVYVWRPWSCIDVDKNNITFCGEDMMLTIMDGQNEMRDAYFIFYGDNIVLKNIYFRPNEDDFAGGAPRLLHVSGKNMHIENCYFEAANGGFYVKNDGFVIRNSTIEKMVVDPAIFICPRGNEYYENFVVDNNSFYEEVIIGGLYSRLYNVTVSNNVFNGSALLADDDPFNNLRFTAGNITGLTITNNVFIDLEYVMVGSYVYHKPAYDVLIEGNEFCRSGLELWYSENITVSHNVFERCSESIHIAYCKNVEIVRNDLVDGGRYGIFLKDHVENIEIAENNFEIQRQEISFELEKDQYSPSDFSIADNYYARRFFRFKIFWGQIGPLWGICGLAFRFDETPADEPFDV